MQSQYDIIIVGTGFGLDSFLNELLGGASRPLSVALIERFPRSAVGGGETKPTLDWVRSYPGALLLAGKGFGATGNHFNLPVLPAGQKAGSPRSPFGVAMGIRVRTPGPAPCICTRVRTALRRLASLPGPPGQTNFEVSPGNFSHKIQILYGDAGRFTFRGHKVESLSLKSNPSFGNQPPVLTAPTIVLAAGAAGTADILLRNRIMGVSNRAGRQIGIQPHVILATPPGKVPAALPYYIKPIVFSLPTSVLSLWLPFFGSNAAAFLKTKPQFWQVDLPHAWEARYEIKRGGGSFILEFGYRYERPHLSRISLAATDLFAAGFETVYTAHRQHAKIREEKDLGALFGGQVKLFDFMPFGYHLTGGSVMGHDPDRGVCGPDGRIWGVDNLFVTGLPLLPPIAGLAYQSVAATVSRGVAGPVLSALTP